VTTTGAVYNVSVHFVCDTYCGVCQQKTFATTCSSWVDVFRSSCLFSFDGVLHFLSPQLFTVSRFSVGRGLTVPVGRSADTILFVLYCIVLCNGEINRYAKAARNQDDGCSHCTQIVTVRHVVG
jgi:hypothetical protein